MKYNKPNLHPKGEKNMTNRHDWPLASSRPAANFGDEMLSAMQKAGIRYMELSSGAIAPFTETLKYADNAKAIYAKAKSYDVTISSIHLPFSPFTKIDPALADPDCRKYMYDLQSGLLRAAGDSGVEIAVIHPSGEPYREEDRPEKMKYAIEMIASLTDAAKSAGIVLALENLPRTCLCRRHDEMEAFLAAIPDLRVCFDTNHNLSESNADYIRAVGDRIVTLHVSDYDFADEKHWFPMEGSIDWRELLSVLEEINYTGRFTYETMPEGKTYEDLVNNYSTLMNL